MKPERIDANSETCDKIKELSNERTGDEKADEKAAKDWKFLARRFVVAAMPEYLQDMVASQKFLKFFQNPRMENVAQKFLTELLSENESRYKTEEHHNS